MITNFPLQCAPYGMPLEGIENRMKLLLWTFTTLFLLPGCSYHFQELKNPFQKLGIKKIYIEQFKNNSFRPGLEYFFTKAFVEEVEKDKIFVTTQNAKEADAILSGKIHKIQIEPFTNLVQIDADTNRPIATIFLASISCSIQLIDKEGREIFYKDIHSTKSYPSLLIKNNRNELITQANVTASLVNESEQRIAAQFVAIRLMKEVYQSMVSLF